MEKNFTAETNITIGSRIIIDLNGARKELQIVGSAEVDAKNGRISYLSPIGEAVLGRAVGEDISLTLSGGRKMRCQIIAIMK